MEEQHLLELGQVIRTHSRGECIGAYCSIHRQMPGPWSEWPRYWREDLHLLERVCPCGIGHPCAEMYLVPQAPGRLVHGCCHVHQCAPHWRITDESTPRYVGDDRPTDVLEKVRDLKTEAADLLLDLWPKNGATVHLETHDWNRLRDFLLAVIDRETQQ